jgi:rod shape-determining protein MreC
LGGMTPFLEKFRLESLEPWIVLALAVILSLGLMATSDRPGTEGVRVRTTAILEVFARPFNMIPSIISLKTENTRLHTENTRLNIEAGRLREAQSENQRLRSLLNFKETSALTLRSAQVIGKNPMPGVNSLLIDAGWNAGVRKNMAVVNDRGLVGEVTRVGGSTSVVQLLLDRSVGAAVRLSNCRADGITSWVGGKHILIEGIASATPVHLGEAVITSGLDGVFPSGIPVGQVIRTQRAGENLFLEIEVEPAADFADIEEIFVVWDNGPHQVP